MEYLERNLFDEIKKWIDRREIIAIKGPRQSGKTTMLEMIRKWLVEERKVDSEDIVFVTFEDRDLLDRFSIDPKGFVGRYITTKDKKIYFFIDEAHYCNGIGQKLKLLYDLFENVKLILTGSSSLELTSKTAKFLVGRVFSFELFPFSFYEFLLSRDKNLASIYLDKKRKLREFIINGKDFKLDKDIFVGEISRYLEEYFIYGGYPEVVKSKREEEKKIILKNIYNTYIEKDIISYLQITDSVKFKRVVSMLSFSLGDLVSYNGLANDCNSYYKEILNFIDVLEQTYIIKLIRPFHRNLITELKKNPKIYFYDFGLRNYVINNFNDIGIRGDSSKIAENFVLNELAKEENKNMNFWRTTLKSEVDFVLSNVRELVPVEVKFERIKKGKLGKSFYGFLNAYRPERGVVITKDFFGEMKVEECKIKFVPIVYL